MGWALSKGESPRLTCHPASWSLGRSPEGTGVTSTLSIRRWAVPIAVVQVQGQETSSSLSEGLRPCPSCSGVEPQEQARPLPNRTVRLGAPGVGLGPQGQSPSREREVEGSPWRGGE